MNDPDSLTCVADCRPDIFPSELFAAAPLLGLLFGVLIAGVYLFGNTLERVARRHRRRAS